MNVERTNQIPWLREIRYAVSHYGYLVADSFIRDYGKDSLRNDILVELLQADAAEQPEHSRLRDSKYRTDGPLDSYAVEIAKNHIRDLRKSYRITEWQVREISDGEYVQEQMSRRPEEIALYDGAILKDGKVTPIIDWQKSGSDSNDCPFENKNTTPNGDDNLVDETLPDIDEELYRNEQRAEFERIYRALKPDMRQALVLSQIHKHPRSEQPELLSRLGLWPKLGLSDSGWDKRWSRTKRAIARLRKQSRIRSIRFAHSRYQLSWHEAYRNIVLKNWLSWFACCGDALVALEEHSREQGVLKGEAAHNFDIYIAASANQLKAHAAQRLPDVFEGRAVLMFTTDQRTMNGSRYQEFSEARTFEDIFLQSRRGKASLPLGDIVSKASNRRSRTVGLVAAPRKSPWADKSHVASIPGQNSKIIVNLLCRGCRNLSAVCNQCQKEPGDCQTTAGKPITMEIVHGCSPTNYGGVSGIKKKAHFETLIYLCRNCLTLDHYQCHFQIPADIKKFVPAGRTPEQPLVRFRGRYGEWRKETGFKRCPQRRAIDFSYCEYHLFRLPESVRELPASAKQEDVVEWVWSPRWYNKVYRRIKRGTVQLSENKWGVVGNF